jgi:hypothetical protein
MCNELKISKTLVLGFKITMKKKYTHTRRRREKKRDNKINKQNTYMYLLFLTTQTPTSSALGQLVFRICPSKQ